MSTRISAVMLVLAFVNPALAGPDCDRKPDHPSCGDGGGDLVDPQVAYRDGGIYVANPDGTGSTLIRSSGAGPKLDAIIGRVLFFI